MSISEEKTNIVINNYFKTECSVDTTIREAFEKGFRLGIKKVKAQERQWIPCSKRLPEEEKKTYWVCTDTEYQCECRWTNNRFGLGEGKWGWSIFDTPQYSKPIAWMPLPEPYREEGEA